MKESMARQQLSLLFMVCSSGISCSRMVFLMFLEHLARYSVVMHRSFVELRSFTSSFPGSLLSSLEEGVGERPSYEVGVLGSHFDVCRLE